MANDDQPSSDIDIDPEHPEGAPITPEGKPVQRAEKSEAASASPQNLEQMETDLYKMQLDSIRQNQLRDQRIETETAPIYAALRQEMAQPLPQMPSMTEQSPYGPPPVDQQTQRGGVLGGILYGLIGLGLAKIFAGRNKSAYYGALDGLGEALRQRNAGQEKQSEQSFNRWLKLNELWHQQLRERVEDYNMVMNNRRLSEQQKLDMIGLIANQHGNTQTEVAARKGDMETVTRMITHLDNMRKAQQSQTWKIIQEQHKREGNSDVDIAYRSHLLEHGYDPDTQWDEAQRNPDTNYKRFLDSYQRQKKTKAGESVPSLGEKSPEEQKAEQDKETREQIESIFGPKPARGDTPSPTPAVPAGTPTTYNYPVNNELLPS